MKQRLFFIAVMLLFTCGLYAQQVVTYTSYSTQTPTSGREKGLIIRPEAGIVVNTHIGYVTFDIKANITYLFSPYFEIGAGLGYEHYQGYINDEVRQPTNGMIPFYATARAYFCDREWSPFIDVKLGGSYVRCYEDTGFYFSTWLGVQFKKFDLGPVWFFSLNSYEHFIGLQLAYNIPLRK